MELSIDALKNLLGDAFDLGYQNSNEFKSDFIEELLVKIQTKPPEEASRVYKCAELKALPEGTIFHHSTRGRCWIIVRPDGSKAMQFKKGGPVGILNDTEPWDRPMKILHSENL